MVCELAVRIWLKRVLANMKVKVLILLGIFIFSLSAFAINGRMTYQAKIIKPDGYPLQTSNVSFRFSILDPVGSCVIYVEDYTAINMTDSAGLISFSLGAGNRTFPTSGTAQTFQNTFDNSMSSFSCQTPGIYNPGPTDPRKIVMQFNDGTGWQTLPAMTMNAVPYAMYATKSQDSQKLNGKADANFVEYSTLASLSCASDQAIKFNGVSFSCITVGVGSSGITSVTTSGTVLSTGGTASAPVISITAASMSSDGYLTSLDYAEFKAKLSASSTQIINTLGYAPVSSSAVATQINNSNLSGDVSGTIGSNSVLNVGGKTAAQISTSVDDTLAASSGAVANALVKRDSSGNFTANDIYANANKINYVDIYKPSTSFNIRLQAPTSLAANYTLNLPTSSGTVGQVLSTDGSGNLSWINPATGSVTSVSATAPLSSTGGSTPTISITQATSSVNGYLSSADWTTFNNKQAATSAAIIATLGYTPAASGSFTSSQWTSSGSSVFYNAGNIGIGTTAPVTKLEVSGGVRIGMESATCAASFAGTLRYTAGNVEYCNGTTWSAFGVSGAGLQSLNGSISGTQVFATGAGGTAPNFVTTNGVHTLNIPYASVGATTAGLISNADYTTFSNKITSSAVSIAQVLGYVPADNAASGTYAQKANNLSDLTNVATARTNLGLGTFATANTIDLGSASATGTLAIARLPAFTGDATIAAASNTIILSNSGVTAGIYTKVTVDGKGRVTSSSALASSDVTTALGYTPANSATIVSSQWNTSGTTINYMNGNTGIGTVSPQEKLHVEGGSLLVTGDWGSGPTLTVSGAGTRMFFYPRKAAFRGGYAYDDEWNENNIGEASFAFGDSVVASGAYSVAMGRNAQATAPYSTAFGQGEASGDYSTAFDSSTAYGLYSVAFGSSSAQGDRAIAMGGSSSANGESSVAIGRVVISNAYRNVAVGSYNIGNGSGTAWIATDPIFEIGNSQNGLPRTNAMTVLKNGNVGVTVNAPTARLHLASGTTTVAPLKFTSGTLLSSPQSGTMEYDGANFYLTDSANTRRTIATGSSAGTIDNASNINSSGNITLTPTGSVVVSSTTASTNSNTGALIVKGGLGVAGNINTSGNLNVSGSSVIDGSLKLSSMTSGSVLFAGANGTVTQDNPNFYWDGANKRLGIGTSAPTQRLEVAGAAALSTAVDAGISLSLKNAAIGNAWNLYNLPSNDGQSPNGLLFENCNGGCTRKMTLTAAGNVGIGTANPAGILHVNGAGWNDQTAIPDTSSFPTSGTGGVIVDNNYSDGRHRTRLSSIDRAGGLGLYIQRSAGVANVFSNIARFGDHTQSNMEFEVFGDAAFSGNVGVGTTAPARKLDVVGTGAFSDKLWAGYGNNNVLGYSWTDSAFTTNSIEIVNNNAVDATKSATLAFHTYGQGGPQFRLDASGTKVLYLESANPNSARNPNAYGGGPNSYFTRFHVDGQQTISGDVGIGTTAPRAKLEVANGANSDAAILATSNESNRLVVKSWDTQPTAVQTFGIVHNFNGDENNGFLKFHRGGSSGGGFLTFGTNGVEQARINTSGYMGLGTSSPAARLNIGGLGAADAVALRIDSQDTYKRDILMTEFNSTTYGGILRYDSGSDLLQMITLESGVEKYGVAVARATGFVGIGMNSTPAYMLDVNGDLRITGTPYRNGGDVAWTVPSDARLKDVIKTYDRGLQEIANIDTIIFKYKKDNPKKIDSAQEYTGVIAQQVQQQIPEAVKLDKDGFLSLNTTPIFWAMINAIKELYHKTLDLIKHDAEQDRMIASVKAENEQIKEENIELKKQNEVIKAYLCAKDPQALICQ